MRAFGSSFPFAEMALDVKMDSSRRFLSLWMILVLAVGVVAEIGGATGSVPRDVLDQLANASGNWWGAPPWLHAAEALLLLLLTAWTSALVFAPGGDRWVKTVGGFAVVLLASHFSPLHAGLTYAPLVGTAVALLLVAWLLRATETVKASRALMTTIRNARPAGAILGSLAAVIVLYTIVNQFGEAGRVISRDTDFGTFYDAALAVTGGADPYASTSGAYFYPPTFAFYFAMVTYLPKAGASLLWFTIKLALIIWTLAAVHGLLEERCPSARGRRWLAVGVVLVAARFLLADLQFGNVNTFVLWLSVAAIVLDLRRRTVLAGLALAAAVSIKIVPAVFLVYFIVRGRHRVALSAGVWLVALNLVPMIAAPHAIATAWASYVDAGVYGKLASHLSQPDNQSLWGAFNRSLDLPLAHVRLVWMACSVALAAVAAWVARKVRDEGPFVQAGAASLFFLLGLLVSPGSWVVHYGAVLLPMSFLLAAGVLGRSRSWWYAVVFVAANVVFTLSGWWRSTVRMSIEQSWFVAASLLLFFTLVFLVPVSRSKEEGSRPATGAPAA